MKKIILTILCLIMPLLAHAANWEFAGWYGGGCYPNLTFDPKNKGRVYLTSDVAGLWRSDDLGEHWNFATKGLGQLMVAQVAIAPSDSNVLYAATAGGVFVSRDAAASWAKTDNMDRQITFGRPQNYRSIAIHPNDPNQLCIGTSKGKLLCSNDAGASWQDLDPEKKSFAEKQAIVSIQFESPDVIIAANATGLIRCRIADKSCAAINPGPVRITDFYISTKDPKRFYLAADHHLWISKDGGNSWNPPRSFANGNIYRVLVDENEEPSKLRVIWNKDWRGGVLRTVDEGVTWKAQDDPTVKDKVLNPTQMWTTANGKLNSLTIDPFNPEVLFKTDWWSVYRSDDGGLSWQEKVLGAPNTVATEVLFAPNGDLYVASMDNGLLKSVDGGKTYIPLFPTKYSDDAAGHVWRAVLSGDTIIGTSSPWNKRINQVIVSDDGGATFSLERTGLPVMRPSKNTMWGQGYPRAIAVDPKNKSLIYLGIDGDDGGGLFISKDTGKTWERASEQPKALRVYRSLAIDPTDSKRIFWGAAGERGGVYVSEDGGKTFDYTFKMTQWPFDIAVASNGTVYIAGDSSGAKLFVSNDHGRRWKETGDFGKGRALAAIAIDPINPKRIVVSAASWGNHAPCHIYLSNDAGKTWQDITDDLPDGSGASSIAFAPDGKHIYIARYAGSVYKRAL